MASNPNEGERERERENAIHLHQRRSHTMEFYGDFFEGNMAGYVFLGWFTRSSGGEKVETSSRSLLITPFIFNNYTVTFNFMNGTKSERVFEFNETIVYPEGVIREGFVFTGWNPSPVLMPANDLAITAQWKEVTEFVEIVFGNKDLTEKRVEEIIREYTDDGFTIIKFGEKDCEVRVIVKFTDEEQAEEFIRSVSGERRGEEDGIKSVEPAKKDEYSFSAAASSMTLFSLLSLL